MLFQRFLGTYGLLVTTVLLAVAFSIAMPASFASVYTWQVIAQSNVTVAFLAIGETICLACGEYDFSISFVFSLLTILVLGLIVQQHVPWIAACPLVILLGVGIGLLNGACVLYGHMSSFIVTLGIGALATGFAWLHLGVNGLGALPRGFLDLGNSQPDGVPTPALALVVLTLALALIEERTPTGRYIYALGASRRSAILAGIRPARYVLGTFAASGAMAAIAAIFYAARFQAGGPTTGNGYLVPILISAILGSSVIRPGRPNIIGTVVAVAMLGIVFAGLQQLGSGPYIQSLFDGFALIFGVGFAGMANRRAAREAANRVGA